MKLIELNPIWVENGAKDKYPSIDRYLEFRCPKCPDEPMPGFQEMRCLLVLPVGKTKDAGNWGWNGETDFEKVTLTPSIWHHCKNDPHFFIENGSIRMV